MRPHPALIPHFKLPNDINNTNCLHIIPPSTSQANPTLSPDLSIPKRFMYKTAKSSDDYGKHWGADDDLTLLNVIENIFKSKQSQQSSASSKIVHVQKRTDSKKIKHQAQPEVTNNDVDHIRFLLNELSESHRQNEELKQMVIVLQNQFELERKWTQRLQNYIRKHFASSSTLAVCNGNNNLRKDIPNVSLIDEGTESNV